MDCFFPCLFAERLLLLFFFLFGGQLVFAKLRWETVQIVLLVSVVLEGFKRERKGLIKRKGKLELPVGRKNAETKEILQSFIKAYE